MAESSNQPAKIPPTTGEAKSLEPDATRTVNDNGNNTGDDTGNEEGNRARRAGSDANPSPTRPDPTRYGDWEKNGRCIDF